MEFALSAGCRGSIVNISTAPGYQPALQPTYQTGTWPTVTPPGFPTSILVGKVVGLTVPKRPTVAEPNLIQTPYVTLTLGGACPTAEKFLYGGKFWYASWGSTIEKQDACCGTMTVGVNPAAQPTGK